MLLGVRYFVLNFHIYAARSNGSIGFCTMGSISFSLVISHTREAILLPKNTEIYHYHHYATSQSSLVWFEKVSHLPHLPFSEQFYRWLNFKDEPLLPHLMSNAFVANLGLTSQRTITYHHQSTIQYFPWRWKLNNQRGI